jgi:NIMA (never in mitosis gene a)-related kinase
MPEIRLPPQMNPIAGFPHNHTRCEKVGDGSEGYVEAWTHKPTGFVMAVKVIKPRKQLPIEVEILKSLPSHLNIINCFAYLPKQTKPHGDCIFFEYCPGSDLFNLQKNMYEFNGGVLSESLMWAIFSQLASAIAFLHEGMGCANPTDANFWRPVIHRDIKIENVLIASRGSKDDFSELVIKLCDFGLAAFYDPKNVKMPGHWGTTVCWPPEQTWENREARPEGDVWAVGCVIHELAHGFPPVEDPEIAELVAMSDPTVPKPPAHYGTALKRSYWSSKAMRKPLPISLEAHEQEWDRRRARPTPRYSNALNDCMMMALSIRVADRATGSTLKAQVEEAHAAFLFEVLRVENEAMAREWDGEGREPEWYL